MGNLNLKTTYFNRSQEILNYIMTRDEGRGIRDLFALYSPNGPVRKAAGYFGEVGGSPLHTGYAEYWNADYVLRRLTGIASLETGFDKTLYAGGKGNRISNMYLSTVGETVERIFGSLHLFIQDAKVEPVVYGSYKTMVNNGHTCLAPDEMPLFADEQYESGDLIYERFTEESYVGWVEGRRLLSGEKIWVPAQLVLMFYPVHPEETMIGYSSSGGLASHISAEEAIYHGVTELVERDAVNIRWNCRRPPRRIEIDRPLVNGELAGVLRTMADLPGGDLGFYLQNIDIEEMPVVTVIQFNPAFRRFGYLAGGGVGVDIEETMLMALNEYGQSERSIRLAMLMPDRGFAYSVHQIFDIDPEAQLHEFDTFFKVIGYYGHERNFKKLDWYVQGEPAALSSLVQHPADTIEHRYERMITVLRKHQIDPIIFDFTPPQLSQMRIIKTFIPDLVPPYVGATPILGHPRYYSVPQKLGWRDDALSYWDLKGRTDPLPYP